MPKVTTHNSKYGHIRHPDDKDHVCFWCGEPVGVNFDYTPSIDIMKNPVLKAEIDFQPYAVTCCLTCKGRVYAKRFELVTIDRKRLYFKSRQAAEAASVDAALDAIRSSKIHPWQMKIFDSEGKPFIVDKPMSEMSETEIALKAEYDSKRSGESKPFIADFGE